MKSNWLLPITLFLAGLLVAGFASVLRSDSMAKQEAQEVKTDLTARIEVTEVRHGEVIYLLQELQVKIAKLETKLDILLEKD